MAQKGPQQRRVIADGEHGEVSLHGQVVELDGREVREAVRFGVAPDEFDGIELGRVGRQQLGANATAMLLEPGFDRFADVGLEPIPDQGDGHAQRAAQLPQKLKNVFAVEARLGQEAEVGAYPMATRRNHQSADDRDLAARAAALPEHGRVTARGPAAPHQGPHEEAGLVYEDDRRAAAPGVFFTRGQSSLTQRRILSSSRSKARRAGFCGLQPNSCSSRPT